MTTSNRVIQLLTASALLFAASFAANAYEVHVLTGPGSESKQLDKGNYQVAIKRLERRVQNETPDSDIQLTNLCTAYVVTGEYEQAKDICDRAVEANGDFVGTAYNSRGVLKSLQGDYIEAMQDFEHANNQSNYPVARSDFGDQAPLNKRFGTQKTETNNSMQIAARNQAAADRTWAAIQDDTDALTAGMK